MTGENHDISNRSEKFRSNSNSFGSTLRVDSRIAYANDCPEPSQDLVEQQLTHLNSCKTCLDRRTEKYVTKSLEIVGKKLTNGASHCRDLEETVPLHYPWWLVFIAGPFQRIENTFHAHCFPQKSIEAGLAFFWCFLWRNPAPVDWVCGLPSAAELMKDKSYQVCVETLNFSQISKGPAIEFNSNFTNGNCMEANLLVLNFSPPVQRRREIYQMNVTAEMTEVGLPLIAFASSINDLSSEPSFLFEPENSTGLLFHETPLNFLVY